MQTADEQERFVAFVGGRGGRVGVARGGHAVLARVRGGVPARVCGDVHSTGATIQPIYCVHQLIIFSLIYYNSLGITYVYTKQFTNTIGEAYVY